MTNGEIYLNNEMVAELRISVFGMTALPWFVRTWTKVIYHFPLPRFVSFALVRVLTNQNSSFALICVLTNQNNISFFRFWINYQTNEYYFILAKMCLRSCSWGHEPRQRAKVTNRGKTKRNTLHLYLFLPATQSSLLTAILSLKPVAATLIIVKAVTSSRLLGYFCYSWLG